MLLHIHTPSSLGYAVAQHSGNLWSRIKIFFSGCSLLLPVSPSVSPWLFVCGVRSPGFCVVGLRGYDVKVLQVGGKKGREQFTRLFDF